MYPEIFLVEDCEDDAQWFRIMLRKAGIQNTVWQVRDGVSALAHLRHVENHVMHAGGAPPGIIVLDLVMPNCGGLEVLKWLHERPAFLPCLKIVLSAVENEDTIREAYRHGIDAYVVKPATTDDVKRLAETYPEFWSAGSSREPSLSTINKRSQSLPSSVR